MAGEFIMPRRIITGMGALERLNTISHNKAMVQGTYENVKHHIEAFNCQLCKTDGKHLIT